MKLLICVINTLELVNSNKNSNNKVTKNQKLFIEIISGNDKEVINLCNDSDVILQLTNLDDLMVIKLDDEKKNVIKNFVENYYDDYYSVDLLSYDKTSEFRYRVDSYFLLDVVLCSNEKMKESIYSIHSLTYYLNSGEFIVERNIKSFSKITIDPNFNEYLDIENCGKIAEKIKILLPKRLVYDCFISIIQAFETKNIAFSQSFITHSKQCEELASNIEIKVNYPSSCAFDFDGKCTKSKTLMSNGMINNLLYSNEVVENDDLYGDVINASDDLYLHIKPIEIEVFVKRNSVEYQYIAIWEESYLMYDPSSSLVRAYLVVYNKREKKKYTKIENINILNFFDSLKAIGQTKNVFNSMLQDLIIEL